MGAPNPEPINNPIERYQTLNLKESLSIPHQYSLACKELGFILKNAYSKSPKILQSIVFQDTLFAFTLLPELQTQSAISAANSLLQSAEFVLPKQKRALAVKEYKRAVVASKRKSKAYQEEEGLSVLPQDVLVHIFTFLDLQSLVSSSAVCRSWNAAAGDNNLWKFLYANFFCNSENIFTRNGINTIHSLEDTGPGFGTDWRHHFKIAFKERCSKKFKANRGYCSSCCSIVWLSSSNKYYNRSCTKDGCNHQIKPMSSHQIVDYILDGPLSSESSSESESDSEDASMFKLWAYPRRIG